jgi:hypothetical protein
MVDKNKKPYLSASQMSKYIQCPFAYKKAYIDGEKSPANGAMFMSGVWHKVVENNYRQKIISGKDLPLKEMQEFFVNVFNARSGAEEIVLNKRYGETPEKLKKQGLQVVKVHRMIISPKVNPEFVEEKFRVSLGENFPYDLLGFWDLIERDGTVADNKAYNPRFIPSQSDLKNDIQLSIYSLAYRLRFNKIEKGLRIDCIAKSNPPRAIQISTIRTDSDVQKTLDLIEKIAYGIRNKLFPPVRHYWKVTESADPFITIKNPAKNNQHELYKLNHPDHNWCNKKFCQYWDECQKQEDEYFVN